jgi:hypothetical protein
LRLAWLRALREPGSTLTWTLAEWEDAIRIARRARLLARLAEGIVAAGLLQCVPPQPRRHLMAEQRLSRWRTSAVQLAIERVAAALGDASYPRVLLKGAAYLGQDLAIAAGRLPSDLDVLVPRAQLADARRRLTDAGWNAKALDAHDRTYYEEWSHEVPPMTHPLLSVELDLHHGILPPVARTTVDADKLLERLKPSKWAGWQVLDPADQLLHSAAHLFFDSEMRDRIRDLADIDGLLRHFGAEPGFISGLPMRARQLGLEEPLALACHFCVRWFGTPIPGHVIRTIESMGPGRVQRAWLLPLWTWVLLPAEPDETWRLRQGAAATVLLVRHHLRRMPLRLLLPHLWHKFRADRRPPPKNPSEQAGG